MSLSSVYQELHRRARETGLDRAYDLKGGARIAVRVRDDITTLTISRAKKRLGDVELVTFKRDCGVPTDAIRFPAEEQRQQEREGVLWYSITYRWREDGMT